MLVPLILLQTCLLVASQSLKTSLSNSGLSATFPGDSTYEDGRQAFNKRFDLQPAAIVFPTSTKQVSDAVKAAKDNGLHVSTRSGGHSYIAAGLGSVNGVMVLDLSGLRNITINSDTATISPGLRLGKIALALNDAGRATSHGSCAYVGLGGHASHGGYGLTSRNWGLVIDNVQSVDVVLANGTIATASGAVNTDLFWGLRGAASSLGVVTSFTLKTYPVPSSTILFRYRWDLDVAGATQAILAFQNFASGNIPSHIGGVFNVFKGSSQGRVFLQLDGGWYAPSDNFAATIQPLLDALPQPVSASATGESYIDLVRDIAGHDLNTDLQPDTHDTFYAKSLTTPTEAPLTENQLTPFFEFLGADGFSETETGWFIQFELFGGSNSAINSVPLDATSFGKRNTLLNIQFYAYSANSQPPYPASGFTLLDNMVNKLVSNAPSNWDYGAYYNYIDDRLDNWEQLYFGSHYSRLQALKRQYDPSNMFQFANSVGL